MAKLTRRTSRGITDGFLSNYKRDDLIQKLGHIEYGCEELAERICDGVCRFREEAEDQMEMDSICEGCPVTQLMDLLE